MAPCIGLKGFFEGIKNLFKVLKWKKIFEILLFGSPQKIRMVDWLIQFLWWKNSLKILRKIAKLNFEGDWKKSNSRNASDKSWSWGFIIFFFRKIMELITQVNRRTVLKRNFCEQVDRKMGWLNYLLQFGN